MQEESKAAAIKTSDALGIRPTVRPATFEARPQLPVLHLSVMASWVLVTAALTTIGIAPQISFPVLVVSTLAGKSWHDLRLRRAVAALELPGSRARALIELDQVARSRFHPPAMRVDAWGYAALERLEDGDLEGALAYAREVDALGTQQARPRWPDQGFVGEAVATILGHLFPESRLQVTKARAFRATETRAEDAAAPRLEPLLGTVRLMEKVTMGDAGGIRRSFNELSLESLRSVYPTLAALVEAAAARAVPSLGEDLPGALQERTAEQRSLIVRRFSELGAEGGGIYRVAAAQEAQTVPQRRAPAGLRAIPEPARPTVFHPVPSRGARWVSWSALAGATLCWALGITSPAIFLPVLVMYPYIAGTPYHRHARWRSFRSLGIHDRTRLSELARMRTRTGPRHGDVAEIHPLERGQIMLVVGLHRAELALADGDPEGAREQIGWWLDGADEAALLHLDLYAIAASLIRVAVLLDLPKVARQISAQAKSRPGRKTRLPLLRSGHGDAPRAVSLARGLMEAHQERWAEAKVELERAAADRPVRLDPFERPLYGELVRRALSAGVDVPRELRALAEETAPQWLTKAWPPRAKGDA